MKGATGPRDVGGLILAAGSSSRMGRSKQLLPFRGKPLLQHVVDVAAQILPRVVLVLGHGAEEITDALSLPSHVRTLVNFDHATGQSSSLRTGLQLMGAEASSALVLVGDQPGIRREAIEKVLAEAGGRRTPVVRAVYGTAPGHPVFIDRPVWAELITTSGDVGARRWMEKNPNRVRLVHLPFPAPIEVDTEEDYRRLLESEGDAPSEPGGGEPKTSA